MSGAQATSPGRPSSRLLRRAARSPDPLWRALAALDPDPRRSALAVLAGTAALGAAIGLMAVSAWLVSRAAQQPLIGVLSVAIVATRALGISRGVLRYTERLISHDVALRGVAGLRERLYRRLAAADPAVVAGLRRGDLLARVGADVDTLADLVVRSVLPFATATLTGLLTVALLAVVLPAAALALGSGLVLACGLAPRLAAVAARRAEQDAAAARARMSGEVLALLDGLAEVSVAGVAPARLRRLEEIDADLAGRLDAAARPAGLAAGLVTVSMGAATLAALALGVRAVGAGSVPEVMLAVLALTPMAAAEIALPLPAAATGFVRSRAAAGRVMELLDAPPDPAAAADRGEDAPGAAEPIEEAHLRATGLVCGWPGRAPALRGVDLDLPPGRRVAVVGPSGGGKTTLLLTLAGLLRPAEGQVRLSGAGSVPTPLPDLPEPVVRRTVSFTAEDAYVFTTTVRENLRVARPDADDAALAGVLARAGLEGWLAGLPGGLDTMLGAGGSDVSGGERRRLLLARALLVGAPLLLLDEPAEHLDPATADSLIGDLLDAGPGVVLVTHRISPLAGADEVLLVDDGRVVARGRHEHLLATQPRYADAWRVEQRGVQDGPQTGATAPLP